MKKTIPFALVSCLALIMFAFTLNKTYNGGYKIGDYADDFSLQNIDGNMVSLSDYKDAKGFIVLFTCNTCPYAVMYEDRLVALDKKQAANGYPVIAIMPNDTSIKPKDNLQSMKKRASEKGFTFPYLIDKNQAIYPKFGATKTPEVFLLQKTSQGYQVKYMGAIDDNYKDATAVKVNYVNDAIEDLLSGHDPQIKETKAIGCSIKATKKKP